jgi:CCR4-NOT complex subunit CAF16
VLLLDEITVDLDVLGRADLLDYLKKVRRSWHPSNSSLNLSKGCDARAASRINEYNVGLIPFVALVCAAAQDARKRNACILYATHIFDGLEEWLDSVAFVSRGKLQFLKQEAELPEIKKDGLLATVSGCATSTETGGRGRSCCVWYL